MALRSDTHYQITRIRHHSDGWYADVTIGNETIVLVNDKLAVLLDQAAVLIVKADNAK